MRKPYGKVKSERAAKQLRRKLSIRKKVSGSTARPRICAIKTNKNLQVQIINDELGKTLFSVQTFGKNAIKATSNLDGAKVVGAEVAKKMKENNITTGVFDRNGNLYTGVLASLADAIRENGIQI